MPSPRKDRERTVASIRFEDEIHEALELLRCRVERTARVSIPGARVTLSDVVRMLIVEGLERHQVLVSTK